METTIKYKVLFNNGKKGSIKVDYDCPDFENIQKEPIQIGSELISTDITIEQQIDEWVSEFDKRDLMDSNDIMIIFNWDVISAKTKESPKTNIIVKERTLTQSELVGLFVQSAPMSDELKIEFIAVYKELKPVIKDLKFDKQIDLTFKSLNIGMKAASQAYRYITEFSKTMSDMKSDGYKSIEYGKTIFDSDKMIEDVKNKALENLK